MSNNPPPTLTPNVVVSDPSVRKGMNVVVSTAALVLGFTLVVDGSSPAFDLSEWTNPITAGVLFLASAFNIAVTFPNYPKGR